MKTRTLFILLFALIFLGSCRIVDFSDNSQHRHLRKVAVDSPDAVINTPDIEKLEYAEHTKASTETESSEYDMVSEDYGSIETAEVEKTEKSHKDKSLHIKNPLKVLSVFNAAPKMLSKVSSEKETSMDPATLLIYALIAVLILALLAVIIPNILELIIGLLIVVLIVLVIIYVAGNI